ncbi:hypothetical protein PHYPSEUDO_006611 [Phytophthora pseudosyringae]|uniref:SGNH hydrolase-type esterase domain-containing protein n=1 Tax=Phytophthora pseudosyringae TaxID=221518 RepID=A0A8T1VI31_9STRA|nr:hypothetical protein PHYPSEUDO_006611 [Phytophthora pseudosyringae]
MARTIHGFLVFLTLAAAFALPVQSQTTSEAQSTLRPVILLTGDSLTEQGTYPKVDGWVALLQARYTRSTDIITRGLSGYNTKWFLNNPEVHVPIEEFTENLREIVRGFQKAAPSAKLLVITPPHIDDAARVKYAAQRTDAKRGLVDRSNAATAEYAHACVAVANELKVSVLDLYALFNAMTVEARNAMLVDGIHFNVAGNELVEKQFRNKLSSDFSALVSSLSTSQFPAASKYMGEDP